MNSVAPDRFVHHLIYFSRQWKTAHYCDRQPSPEASSRDRKSAKSTNSIPESSNCSDSKDPISWFNIKSSIYIIPIPLSLKSHILKVILPLPRIQRYFCQIPKQEGWSQNSPDVVKPQRVKWMFRIFPPLNELGAKVVTCYLCLMKV